MAQVLPYVPSFGEKLASSFGQAAGDIGQGLQQRQAMKSLNQLLNPQPQNGQIQVDNLSPIQKFMTQDTGGGLNNVLGVYNVIEKALGPKAADAGIRTLLQQQKMAQKEQSDIRKEERALEHKADEGFFEKISTDRMKIPEEQFASDMILDAVKSGEIDPFSPAHIADIAKAFGAPDALTTILETPGSKEFKTARKTFIGNTIKDAFRGTTTKIEINLAEDMLAEVGISKEGNLASTWGLQAALDIKKERVRLADQLRDEGVPASKIPRTVDKMLQPYIEETKKEYFDALRELKRRKKGGE